MEPINFLYKIERWWMSVRLRSTLAIETVYKNLTSIHLILQKSSVSCESNFAKRSLWLIIWRIGIFCLYRSNESRPIYFLHSWLTSKGGIIALSFSVQYELGKNSVIVGYRVSTLDVQEFSAPLYVFGRLESVCIGMWQSLADTFLINDLILCTQFKQFYVERTEEYKRTTRNWKA